MFLSKKLIIALTLLPAVVNGVPTNGAGCPEFLPEEGAACGSGGTITRTRERVPTRRALASDQVCRYGELECCDGTKVKTDKATCVSGKWKIQAMPTNCPKCEDRKPDLTPPKTGSGSGDPHFKTWNGDKYDYHGECDLVLLDHPDFMNGLGMAVHIRTTRVKHFSFIEKIAVQIGADVLEFDNDVTNFLINGTPVGPNKKHHKTLLGKFIVRRDPTALSIRLNDNGSAKSHNHLGAKIDLIARKNGFPAVIVDGGGTDVFAGSLGLLGETSSGKKIARDGLTEMNDPDATAFALEWQVRDTEPMLFKEARYPQFPDTCTPPEAFKGEHSAEKLAEAEAACEHWKEDKDDCVFDVLAVGDVLVAEEGHYAHVARA